MPSWKKIITSGSNATLNSLFVSTSITASIVSGSQFTGSLFGTASWANNALTSSNILGGATNYIALWNSATTLSSSVLFQSASNIGIGTINPLNKLHIIQDGTTAGLSVSGGINPHLRATDGNTITKLQILSASNLGLVGTETNHDFAIYTNNTEKVRIGAGGNVSITGSLTASGSLTIITGSGVEFQVLDTGVKIGNIITDRHSVTGSINVSGSITSSLFGTASWALNAFATLTGGTTNYIPIWATNTTLTSSIMYQSSSRIAIGAGAIIPGGTLVVRGEGVGSATKTFILQNASARDNVTVLDNGNVGLGTTSPTATLEISGTLENGVNTLTSGLFSHAEGQLTTASGDYSHAQGDRTRASGSYSHAEGNQTLASGSWSHTEGLSVTASGLYSHAEGVSTIAFGNGSHAEGGSTTALGLGSHAEGSETTASGSYSHAEGFRAISSGSYSHAEGDTTRAIGQYSHAEGTNTIASGSFSHAEGDQTISFGAASHAEGNFTRASGSWSHAEGQYTTSSAQYSHAEGYYSVSSGDYSHAEGSGSRTFGIASHAEGINTIASGSFSHAEGRGTTASGSFSHAEGDATQARGNASHAEGYNTIASDYATHAEGFNTVALTIYSHAEGRSTLASGESSHAEGFFTTASGFYSHAEGSGSLASGFASHAEGDQTIASGSWSHAEGQYTIASGSYSHAEGLYTTSSGQYSHAEGFRTIASGSWSHAEGNRTLAFGPWAHAEGSGSVASGSHSHAEGFFTTSSGQYSHAEGYYANALAISSHAEGYFTITSGGGAHAEGTNTTASGDYSHAEGSGSLASGIASHAEGRNTVASGDNSHAEGSSSLASGIHSHAEGRSTQATNNGSHAEGFATVASGISSHAEGGFTNAYTLYDHAEGELTVASGSASHTEGLRTSTSGAYSHAEGELTLAVGRASHAEGYQTKADKDYSHAAGNNTVAFARFQSVVGGYNLSSTTEGAFIVGNGTSDGNRKNLLFAGGSQVDISGSLYAISSVFFSGLTSQSRTNIVAIDTTTGQLSYMAASQTGGGGGGGGGTGNITGSGTATYIPLWSGSNLASSTTLIDSIIYQSSSRIGIGTVTPGATLEVVGTLENGENTIASGLFSHAEGRSSQATRRYAHAEGWEVIASGEASHAEGDQTIAFGTGSHTEGYKTLASASYSHAEGYETQANFIASHAEGYQTTASAFSSHAEGKSTRTPGQYSHAEGESTIATGEASHAEGFSTVAAVQYSHAEGYNTRTSGFNSHAEGEGTLASGISSHAEGYYTTASGYPSHAEGISTLASGIASHAEGIYTTASGYSSHAEGSGSKAIGDYSHAEGKGTLVSNAYAHAEGLNTTVSGEASHAEGKNTLASNDYAHAEGQSTTASGPYSHAEGLSTVAFGISSHAEGESTLVSGRGSHVEGYYTTASGDYSHAEGSGSVAFGIGTHAEGNQTISSGSFSHAEGYFTVASGPYSHAEGDRARSLGTASHAEGYNTRASGENSHAEGYETLASGRYSHAEGQYATSSGESSHAAGLGTIASSSYQFVAGMYNVSSSIAGAFIIGNGTSPSARRNVLFAGGILGGSPGPQVQISGSLYATSSVFFSGLTSQLQTNIVAIDSNNGQLSYLSTSSFANGSGTTNYIPLWTSGPGTTLGNSVMYQSASSIGIGTTSPLGLFSVYAGVGQVGFLGGLSSPNRGSLFYDTDNTGWKFNIGKLSSSIYTPQMTFQDNGNIGIGTTSPTVALQVTGAISASGQILNNDIIRANTNNISGSARIGTYFNNTSIAQFVNNVFANNSTTYGFMQAGDGTNYIAGTKTLVEYGNVGIGAPSPGARLVVQGAGAAGGKTFVLQNSTPSETVTVFDNGNVNIGFTTDQGYKLAVSGTTQIGGNTAGVSHIVGTATNTPILWTANNFAIGSAVPQNTFLISSNGTYASMTGTNNFILGRNAGVNLTTGNNNTFIGNNMGRGITTGGSNVLVGASDATNIPSNLDGMLHLTTGYRQNDASSIPTTTARRHAFIGGGFNSSFAVRDYYFGQMPFTAEAASLDIAFYAPAGSGSDIGGAPFTIAAGRGTGIGTPADLIFQTSTTGSTGATVQTLSDRIRIKGNTGNVIIGSATGLDTGSFRLNVSGSGHFVGGITTSGSFTVFTGSGVEFQVTNTGTKIGNVITDAHTVTGSINVSGSITSSLFGTASWAQNAVSASFASTASFVNTLNQNVLITGSLTVGASSLGAAENTLTLGPRGTQEGGQLLLQAATSYTSASMLDVYHDGSNPYFRILRGSNAGSDAIVGQFNLHTKQVSFPAYNSSTAFTGTPTAFLAVDNNGNILTTTGSGAGGGLSGGSANYIARWASSILLTTGSLWDNGTNVGIGTLSPTAKLHISGATSDRLFVASSSFGTVMFISGSGNVSIASNTNFSNYTLDVNGNLLVRNTGAGKSGSLVVYSGDPTGVDQSYIVVTTEGSSTNSIGRIDAYYGAANPASLHLGKNNGGVVVSGSLRVTGSLGVGVAPSATIGRIDASNDVVAFSISDERLKENIRPIENAIYKVNNISGIQFDWKSKYKLIHGYEGNDVGVIAQEIEKVLPEAIRKNNTGYLAVRYEKIIPLLIEAVKDQQKQIDELKAKIDGITS